MSFSWGSLTLLNILRIAQLVFTILCLGLAAETVNVYSNDAGYLVFVAAWTLLALAYLVFAPVYWTAAVFHRLAPFFLELLTNVFWFTAFIVMASIYGPGSCGVYDYGGDYYYAYYYPYSYYGNYKTACESSKAAIAFAAVTWVLFVVTSVIMSNQLFGMPTFRRADAAAAGAGPTDVEAAAAGPGGEAVGAGAGDVAGLGEKAVGDAAPVAAEPAVPVPAYSSPSPPVAETVAAPVDASAEAEKPV
ncbi:membrane-associating domain-containing protein [Lipomyces kononenkoae]